MRDRPEHIRPIDERPLRDGRGKGGTQTVRPRDGAKAYRASLQKKTPAARRIHYWVGTGGDGSPMIEFANVKLHDELGIDGA